MKRSLLIAAALVAAFSIPTLAQNTEPASSPAPTVASQESIQKDKSPYKSQTIGDMLQIRSADVGRKALIVVDGAVVSRMKNGESGPMDTKVSEIEKIEVVKEPTELAAYATLYGKDANNGVILITTKHPVVR